MLVLFVVLNRLIAALQKTLTFRAELLQFASKSHPKRTSNSIMWGRMWGYALAVIIHRLSSIVHFRSSLARLFHVGECGGSPRIVNVAEVRLTLATSWRAKQRATLRSYIRVYGPQGLTVTPGGLSEKTVSG
jgi:hypothetical protein